MLEAQGFVTVIPGTKSIIRMTNGQLEVLENTDGLSASIVELDMISVEVGWAKSVDSSCVTASPSDRYPCYHPVHLVHPVEKLRTDLDRINRIDRIVLKSKYPVNQINPVEEFRVVLLVPSWLF